MKKIIAISIIAFVATCIWVYRGPSKGINIKTSWAIDTATNREIPNFNLYYAWDGLENTDATWFVFPKSDEWWVIDLRDASGVLNSNLSQEQMGKILNTLKQKFTLNWINNLQFQPKLSRLEAIMSASGFKPLYNIERRAFLEVFDLSNKFDNGILKPDY